MSPQPLSPPPITVLLPAYNAEAVIGAAIASILGQTMPDFELLIINDGSTDGTAEQIASFPDPRITVRHHPVNQGLIATLNQGLDLARGKYIARMDADDLSLPRRFEWQYRLMEECPKVVACGGWSVDFSPHTLSRYYFRERDHEALLARMMVEPPLSHPASFIRGSTLREHHIRYDQRYPHCEDYRLWFDLAQVGRLANVQKLVVRCRRSANSVSQRYSTQQAEVARGLRREIINDFFRQRQIAAEIPARITGKSLTWFNNLAAAIVEGTTDQADRRHVLRQLNSIRYCLYMSMEDYSPTSLLRFLLSGDWYRSGLLGLRTAKVVRRHLQQEHTPPLL